MKLCEYMNNIIEIYLLNIIIDKDLIFEYTNDYFPLMGISRSDTYYTFLKKYNGKIRPLIRPFRIEYGGPHLKVIGIAKVKKIAPNIKIVCCKWL